MGEKGPHTHLYSSLHTSHSRAHTFPSYWCSRASAPAGRPISCCCRVRCEIPEAEEKHTGGKKRGREYILEEFTVREWAVSKHRYTVHCWVYVRVLPVPLNTSQRSLLAKSHIDLLRGDTWGGLTATLLPVCLLGIPSPVLLSACFARSNAGAALAL